MMRWMPRLALRKRKRWRFASELPLTSCLFRVRDRIVDLMSEYRAEWRKRYGNS